MLSTNHNTVAIGSIHSGPWLALLGRMAHQRAWRRGLGITAVVVVCLPLLAAVLAEPIVERIVEHARVDLQARLERPVSLGIVDASPLRGRLLVQDVRIGPGHGEPEDAAALVVPSVEVDVGVWRTLLTLGRRVHIQKIEVTRPLVHVVRRADRDLNWSEIAARQQPTRESPATSREFYIEEGSVAGGTLHFSEANQANDASPVSISQVNISLANFSSDRGGRLALRAAVLAKERNVKLDAQLRGLDELPVLAAIDELSLRVAPTPLAPFAPYLSALVGPDGAPEQGRLSADVRFIQTGQNSSEGIGHVAIDETRFDGGRPFDVRLQFDVLTDRLAEELVFDELALLAAGMRLDARGKLSQLSEGPRIEHLELASSGLDFDTIHAHYPALRRRAASLQLRGPFSIRADGEGTRDAQHGEFELSLTGARVALKDVFEKPPGTPATLRAQLHSEGNRLTLERGVLQLSSWQLVASGHAERRNEHWQSYAVRLETPQTDLDGLLRLLPPMAEAFSEGPPPRGELRLSMEATANQDEWHTQGNVQMYEVNARVPPSSLTGSGSLRFDLRGENSKVDGQLLVDLSDFEAIHPDVVHKPKGTPLKIQARLRDAGNRTRADFELQVASLSANGHATLRPRENGQEFTAEAALQPWRVRPVLALLPASPSQDVPDVRFKAMQIRASGVTARPETFSVELESFAAESGRSNLRGKLRFTNFTDPQVAFEGRSTYLNLDDFSPPSKREPKTQERAPSPLANADGLVELKVDEGRAADVPYRNLQARLVLEDGRARAETLELEAFGGSFSGTGSSFPLFTQKGPYRFEGRVEAVRLEALLARFAKAEKLMNGSLGARFALTATDTTPRALAQSLSGTLSGKVEEAEFLPGNVMTPFVAQVAKLPGTKLTAPRTGAWELGDLSGRLTFSDGSVVIEEPLTAKTPYGPLAVRGEFGLGGPAQLRGTIQLRPKALRELLGADLSLKEPLALEFRMNGSLEQPRFALMNLERTLAPLLRGYVKQGAGREVERTLREAVRGVLEPSPSKDNAKPRKSKQEKPNESKRKKSKRDESPEDSLRRRLKELL